MKKLSFIALAACILTGCFVASSSDNPYSGPPPKSIFTTENESVSDPNATE